MNIQLMEGAFNANEAIELIAQMIHIKIKYNENQINSQSNEEDIKTREAKIKRLQQELSDLRKTLHTKNNHLKIEAVIIIEEE